MKAKVLRSFLDKAAKVARIINTVAEFDDKRFAELKAKGLVRALTADDKEPEAEKKEAAKK
jgi:hypothetical protein